MINIKEIIITDYTLEPNVGYEGEHRSTNLNIRLTNDLISENIDYYTIEFKPQGQSVIPTEALQQEGGYLTIQLWQQIMVSGILEFQVIAWRLVGGEVSKIGKSPIIKVKVGKSINGEYEELDDNVSGLIVELQNLIANYPVQMGEFNEGAEWNFELVEGLLNITYVKAKDGEDGDNGLTPEIGGNGNWFIGGVDTGILADVTLDELRHSHDNKEVIDQITEQMLTEVADLQSRVSQIEQGSTGGGILTVETVDDLPDDAADGALAMVRFVDRTGQLMFGYYNRTEYDDGVPVTRRYSVSIPSGRMYASDGRGLTLDPDLLGAEWTISTMCFDTGADDYCLKAQYLLRYAVFITDDFIPTFPVFIITTPVSPLSMYEDVPLLPVYMWPFVDIVDMDIDLNLQQNSWYRLDFMDGQDVPDFVQVLVPELEPSIAAISPVRNPESSDNYDGQAGGDTSKMMEWISKVFAHKPFHDVIFVRHGDTWIERGL